MDIKKLAENHWEYVKLVILLHEQADRQIDVDEVVNLIGFHYKSALMHGYGHGLEEGYKQGVEAAKKGNSA
jgi:hypothetical protein